MQSRPPALRALLLQFTAFLLTLGLAYGLRRWAGWSFSLPLLALAQGVLAAALSYWRRLAPWWLPIQLLFPLAFVFAPELHIPPTVFLLAFLFLLCLYWTTFRTQVPYYPSNRAAWDAVAALLPARPLHVIDIGSGLGGFALDLAARRADCRVDGIEVAPLPWLASALRARLQRSRARFLRGDYRALDFAGFDVVFAYLSPAAMPALWQKARTEMRPGSLLLSYEFTVPDAEPDIVTMPSPNGPALYGWRF